MLLDVVSKVDGNELEPDFDLSGPLHMLELTRNDQKQAGTEKQVKRRRTETDLQLDLGRHAWESKEEIQKAKTAVVKGEGKLSNDDYRHR